MCGRYRLARKKEILAETFDVDNDVEWSPRYNVAPGQNVPVIRQGAESSLTSAQLWEYHSRSQRITALYRELDQIRGDRVKYELKTAS
jgi:putative SOS response-associated peptidase YedK